MVSTAADGPCARNVLIVASVSRHPSGPSPLFGASVTLARAFVLALRFAAGVDGADVFIPSSSTSIFTAGRARREALAPRLGSSGDVERERPKVNANWENGVPMTRRLCAWCRADVGTGVQMRVRAMRVTLRSMRRGVRARASEITLVLVNT